MRITQADREFMKQSRKEMVAGRESAIQLKYMGPGIEDDITGEIIGGGPVLLDGMGVVTEISGDERFLENGIAIQKGDMQVSVDYDIVGDDYEKYTDIIYKRKNYTILSIDAKGIGSDNRVEIVARLTS